MSSSSPVKPASHRERGDDLDGPFVLVGAEGHASAAEPALIGVHFDGGLPLFRIRRKGIAHAYVHTDVAPRAGLLVEVNVPESHIPFSKSEE